MANSFTAHVNLGRDPEAFEYDGRKLAKLRVAESAPGKKNVTRWLNATVSGKDVDTALRLRKGDSIMISGQLGLEEYAPKKPRYRGEKIKEDAMPFAKILQVTRSESFFGGFDSEAGEDGPADTSAPDLSGDDQASFVDSL